MNLNIDIYEQTCRTEGVLIVRKIMNFLPKLSGTKVFKSSFTATQLI